MKLNSFKNAVFSFSEKKKTEDKRQTSIQKMIPSDTQIAGRIIVRNTTSEGDLCEFEWNHHAHSNNGSIRKSFLLTLYKSIYKFIYEI